MERRAFFRRAAGAGLASLLMGSAEAQAEQTAPADAPIRITRIKSLLTAPGNIRLVLVKVETTEPGLYGWGCATFTQRARAVETAIDHFLTPLLKGKDPHNIEDIWQATYQSSYWRNGPVLMNALSGLDMALWDIKGKRAGMPVYQLLGGKCRESVPVYRHASGETPEKVAERVQHYMSTGARYVRAQVGIPGHAAYGSAGKRAAPRSGHFAGDTFYPAAYRQAIPKLFEYLRKTVGDEVELLHDVHERLHPIQAIGLAKDLEAYRLFFLEDPFAPEDIGYFKTLRQQTAVAIAMGELYNHPLEWIDLVSGRLIDFVRCHLSQIGGISVAKKLANFCDFYRVRTAWHGPGDVSPVGHAANYHVDFSTWNFGIQEYSHPNDATQEVFPGAPLVEDGTVRLNDKPGLGVDVNEALAAKYPIRDNPPFDLNWGQLRDRDGTVRRP
jgi:mannonate dehydratase